MGKEGDNLKPQTALNILSLTKRERKSQIELQKRLAE